jgi:hypothetical protein
VNPLWPSALTIDGVALSLDEVLADVAIHHGRSDVNDEPTPDTCQVTLQEVTKPYVDAFKTGVQLVLKVQDQVTLAESTRFTGRVTDASLDVDLLTVIAVGRLSTLGAYPIGGTVDWPAETWSARVTRIFTEAGLAAQLDLIPDPKFDPLLVSRDHLSAGPTTLADYLGFLAPMIGAAVTDTMDGKVRVQAIGARTLGSAVTLPPDLVLYAPAWKQFLPQGNIVTVRYTGDQSEQVTVRDNASVALYGERPTTIDTTFQNVSDATTRANTRLARAAFPHWNIPEAPVLEGLALQVGAPLVLHTMPEASPFDPWQPIVEGWTDNISRDSWTMTVALSDPLASGLTLPWNAVPPADPAYVWNTVDPATDWTEALTLESLNAG